MLAFTYKALALVGAMGAINNNLYLALRQKQWDAGDDLNPVILAKMDAGGNVLDNVLVPSTSSRPAFFMRGTTELYLAFSSDNRNNTTIIKVESLLRNSIPYQDVALFGNYLTVCPRSSNLQFVNWTGGTTGVRVSSMNFGQKTSTDVMVALMLVLGI